MPNNYFKFKQFIVFQDKCAMKVGTDGVLLGAWASANNPNNILDIGTGTGLISLMLAQRYKANITAIDIDRDSFLQSTENLRNSPWADKLNSLQISLQEFAKTCNTKFDLIVSNPPYFDNSLKSIDDKRTKARHTDTLSFSDLVTNAKKLLDKDGIFSVIIPSETEILFCNIAKNNNLFCIKKTYIKPTPNKPAKRILLQFSMIETKLIISELIVEITRHNYTVDYINLTKDFYLNM